MKVPDGITRSHLNRKGVIYVRQSTEGQVKHNTASQHYQREQRKYALRYGWNESQIEVVEDLGQSASISGNRGGYENILKEISENRVGGIFYHDLSRLSRNTMDFQVLLWQCKIHDVLFFEDGRLLDPKDSMDSFMVSIRAGVAQLENQDRSKKSQDGMRAKIKSGYAVSMPPVGYVVVQKGVWDKHPDEQVRRVLEYIFEKAKSMPSLYALWQSLLAEEIQLPAQNSRKKDDIVIKWRRPRYHDVINLLRNPNYTQDYHYRQQVVDPRRGYFEKGPNKGKPKLRRGEDDETLIIRDHHEPYIDRDLFYRLKEKFQGNAIGRFQPVREGKNLLQGISHCGHCGRRIASCYGVNKQNLRYYVCRTIDKPCAIQRRYIRAETIDKEVEDFLMQITSKPSVDSTVEYYENQRKKAFMEIDEYELLLKQAEQRASRAEQAYKAVDSKNTMVKQKMEEDWQGELQALEELRKKPIDSPEPLPPLSKEQRERFRFLCENFPKTFKHPSLDPATKKRLVRAFIKKAVISLEDDLILVDLHGFGSGSKPRRLTIQTLPYIYRYIRKHYDRGLDEDGILKAMERDGVGIRGRVFTRENITSYLYLMGVETCSVRKRKIIHGAVANYHNQGLSPIQITERLNEAGISPIRAPRFTESNVRTILQNLKLKSQDSESDDTELWRIIGDLIDEGLTLNEIANHLNNRGFSTSTGLPFNYNRLRKAIKRKGYQLPQVSGGLPAAMKEEIRSLYEAGKSSGEAYENLLQKDEIGLVKQMKDRIISYHRSLNYRLAAGERVPERFKEMIDLFIADGLTAGQIAAELNRLGEKPIRGKKYTKRVVYRYCSFLEIPLNKRGYESDSKLMGTIYTGHAAGESCKEIAENLLRSGFSRYWGDPFDAKTIAKILKRNGKIPIHKDPAERIVKEIKSLTDRGYHPRTVARKLNAMGLKTRTGLKFKPHHITYHLRRMKAAENKQKTAAEMLDQVAESKSAVRTSDEMKKGVFNVG